MYKIILLCENGASTGLCAKKIKEAADNRNIDMEVEAYAHSFLDEVIDEADLFMLGPQISYMLEELKSKYSNYENKFATISPIDFGMLNGEKILDQALGIISRNKGDE